MYLFIILVVMPFAYNLTQWMRLLRVQIQLRTETETTNAVISKMNNAKRMDYLFLGGMIALEVMRNAVSLICGNGSYADLIAGYCYNSIILAIITLFIGHLWQVNKQFMLFFKE